MTNTETYYNVENGLYYRINANESVEMTKYLGGRGTWMSSAWGVEEIRNNPDTFEPYGQPETNQAKNAWKAETVTVEVPKQNALVGHIEELQRVITRRNKRIEELEGLIALKDEIVKSMSETIDDLEAQLNAEADEEPEEPQLAEPGVYARRCVRDSDRWVKMPLGYWIGPLGGLVASAARTAEWEANNLQYLKKMSIHD